METTEHISVVAEVIMDSFAWISFAYAKVNS